MFFLSRMSRPTRAFDCKGLHPASAAGQLPSGCAPAVDLTAHEPLRPCSGSPNDAVRKPYFSETGSRRQPGQQDRRCSGQRKKRRCWRGKRTWRRRRRRKTTKKTSSSATLTIVTLLMTAASALVGCGASPLLGGDAPPTAKPSATGAAGDAGGGAGPWNLRADASNLYWLSYGLNAGTGSSVSRMPQAGGTPSAVSIGDGFYNFLVSSDGTIYGADLAVFLWSMPSGDGGREEVAATRFWSVGTVVRRRGLVRERTGRHPDESADPVDGATR